MKKNNIIAAVILLVMFGILFFSAKNDAATFDEIAHIGAGYTYLKYKDARLNPEHPPLAKDLAAFPLMFLDLNFDTFKPFWTNEDVHSRQWEAGRILLYESGNDPDQIIFWMRIPMMLLSILFGWLLYRWVKSIYGPAVGLLVLIFYAFSPTFIAHSRYVTTDVAAAFGFFIGIASFTRFLEKPILKRTIVAGIALGVGLLFKFSLFLLVPIYGLLTLLWVFLEWRNGAYSESWREVFALIGKIILIGLVALALIYAVYLFHVWNYPQDQQLKDAEFVTRTYGLRPLVELDLTMIKNEYLRPLGQYLMGLLMVFERARGGNTTYFMGEVSASGWPSYFPTAYFLKETLAFHALTLLALFLALRKILKSRWSMDALFEWTKDNFVLAASLFFVIFYWAYSINSTLNIGVRHVLPTFPFIYLLVAREISSWLYIPSIDNPGNLIEWIRSLYESFVRPLPKVLLVVLVLLLMIISVFAAFPFYLSYYNEIVGMDNGHKYIVDSNYDWGQDLKRLRDLVERDPIFANEKIYLDYFGGGAPSYYLGSRFEPWWSARGLPPAGSYFAVSASTLRGAQGKAVGDITIKPQDSYWWLKDLEPITRAGKSIFIYQIP